MAPVGYGMDRRSLYPGVPDFFAGLTGLALGYSKFSPLVAALFSAVYGTFCMGWLFGTTVDLDITWRERIVNHLSWRLQLSIEQFNANQAVTDPILFLVIMAVLLWIMASIATFIIVRQGSVWPVLIPLGFRCWWSAIMIKTWRAIRAS